MTIQNKDRIMQKMQERQKAMQEQQQKMSEMQLQQMQVDNETKLSYARSQDGLAKERTAKIQTDVAVAQEKIKRSQQEETAGILNLIKALKELEGMDTTHLAEKINLMHNIKDLEVKEGYAEQVEVPKAM